MDFTPLNEVRFELGESPVYDDRSDALYQCDIVAKKIYRFPLSGGEAAVWTFPSEVGAIGLAESGRLVVALRHSVVLFNPDDGSSRLIAEIETAQGPVTRLNDGKVGPDGAFWIGSMDERPRPVSDPQGALYRVTADGKVEQKVTGLFTSNGLAFAPDGRGMFHTDSYGRWIDRWKLDPATGAISGRTRIATQTEQGGRPDGGATDGEGYYWSAGVSAECVNRYAPDGRLVETYAVPVAGPGRLLERGGQVNLRLCRPLERIRRIGRGFDRHRFYAGFLERSG